MLKERVKTVVIVLLLASCGFLTFKVWFASGLLGSDWLDFDFAELPLVRLFTRDKTVSVPKENLSKPRKIVINDGALWVPYYNTDSAFDTLDERTSEIIKSALAGKGESVKEISYDEWLSHLDSPSVYVEYPISVQPEMLSMILNISMGKLPGELDMVRDAIIIPMGEEGVSIALRDFNKNRAWEFYIADKDLSFPRDVLNMFTRQNQRDGYYEFAYSTLIGEEGLGEGAVKVGDLVLFSDNDTSVSNIYARNPLQEALYGELLKSFSFNPDPIRRYNDAFGGVNYVENYATVKIFPDGYIEYSAVSDEKGIELNCDSDNKYEILNSVIDFAQKVWESVSDKSFDVLVSGIEETETGVKITFDYYYGGREVAINHEQGGAEALHHAIEVSVVEDRIVSYRQYMRYYTASDSTSKQESFITALDYYVELFEATEGTVITDLYPGYFDDGKRNGPIKITWLGEINYSDVRYPKR